ncbi:hypothetical protein GLO73106DRAFT_00028340 [Gloeocapsa sp. PCC 73106]|nr:hypothetical protein GLO73106DRAFT_00028340 [Gloeocapsa sp. PCC 73106]
MVLTEKMLSKRLTYTKYLRISKTVDCMGEEVLLWT